MPFPGHTLESYIWSRDRVLTPEEAAEDCPNLMTFIKHELGIIPSVSLRVHSGDRLLTIMFDSATLHDQGFAASLLPTDRYPQLRKLASVAKKEGLELRHQSEAYPHVIFEYRVGVPDPERSFFEVAITFLKKLIG